VTVVVDASVVLKWLLGDARHEPDAHRASQLMRRIAGGEERAIQPVHWLLEVGAVLTRKRAPGAEDDVLMLQAMNLAVDESPEVIRRACRLAVDLGQHLFDTAYHAVALENAGAVLVTADERYLGKSRQIGRIVGLAEWQPG
jgi:predicted nucleic acid-binding protein